VSAAPELTIRGLTGLPEVQPGDDLVALIADGLERVGLSLQPGDVLVVTHKIVSKAEGRLVDLRTIEPSPLARQWAATHGKDARQVEVALRESVRIVRMDRGVLIVETRHGLICANAGVDASNVAPETVCLLPEAPDRSARALQCGLEERLGVRPAVIVTDSFGRPWRNGIVNVAIGVAGLPPLADYRGEADAAGYQLHVSVLAIADELAAAAELVMNKLDGVPAALIRGYRVPLDLPEGSGRDLIIDPARDLFR
jgi:coenzyme F420-0:L-glutamate ligase/coenzyme F420-1:gamma-L-glutamate ligase